MAHTPRKTAQKAPGAALAKAIAAVDPPPLRAATPVSEGCTANITVGLSKGKGFGSWWIRWLAKGGWSHCVALVLTGGTHVIDARSNVIDGIAAGVQIRPISYLKGEKCLWLEIPCTPEQAEAVEAAARSVIGKPYDVKGIEDFVTNAPDNSWKTAKNFFCSALGAWICWKGGLLGKDVLVPFTNIDPGDVLDLYWGLGARKAPTPAGLA